MQSTSTGEHPPSIRDQGRRLFRIGPLSPASAEQHFGAERRAANNEAHLSAGYESRDAEKNNAGRSTDGRCEFVNWLTQAEKCSYDIKKYRSGSYISHLSTRCSTVRRSVQSNVE